MRNLKKFLALVLSMMMVLSLFVTASAKSIDSNGKGQEFKDTTSSEFQTAIDVLAGMEVLKGDAKPGTSEPTGNFRPNDTITRAEVAALVFRLSTGVTDSNGADHYARYGSFSDVPKDAWYAGYVGYCANAGYVKGYAGETGPFGPSDPVTGYQALAMILRAMGYGVNGEFEGADWRLNVSKVGTQTKILDGINNSHFGNETLYGPAPRAVVAEIYFQAIQTPCVVYTPAFGYQTTDITTGISGSVGGLTGSVTDNGLTAGGNTLGYRYFGLTEIHRVIVGNKDTGESNTIVGGPLNTVDAYAYPGTAILDDDGNFVRTTTGQVTLKVDTDIMLFGHKVQVFYDARYGGACRTYAIYDEAKYAYAYSADGDVDGTLGKMAADAKMSVNKADGFHISDRFGFISADTSTSAAQFVKVDETTYPTELYAKSVKPVVGSALTAAAASNVDEDTVAQPYGSAAANGYTGHTDGTNEAGSYYMLISNGGNNLDLVITLAPELERVTEHDTTNKQTVRLSGQSDGTLGGAPGPKPSTFGVNDDGYVRFSSLTDNSEKAIGSLVVGWEIKGTNYSVDYKDEINKDDASLYKYWLQPVTESVTGTVKYYNGATGEVTLATNSGDKTLKFTRLPVINRATRPALDIEHGGDVYFYNGETYTFQIDPTDSSRYVSWSQGNDYKFLYATYGDYEVGGLGTGDLKYYVTGVNWEGKIENNLEVATINDLPVNGARYENLTIAKKNLGSANAGGIVGNEIMRGYYTGYGYNAGTKDLHTTTAGLRGGAAGGFNWIGDFGPIDNPTNDPSTDTGYTNFYWDGKLVSDCDVTNATNTGVWTVGKGNVADGWAEQPSSAGIGGLLLTPQTKFIIVDGTGSSTLNVEIKNGIADLLGTDDVVRIDVKQLIDNDGDGAPDAQNDDLNVYYQLFDDQYNNWYKDNNHLAYSDDNYMVKTVILPKAAVSRSSSNNLWFTNRNSYNGVYLAGVHADTDFIEQVTMWQNGVENKVFVDTRLGTLGDNGIEGIDRKVGRFYELTEAYKVGGTPIYMATEMRAPEQGNVYQSQNSRTICNVDMYYDYTAVNNTSTARLTQVAYTPNYDDGAGNTYSSADTGNVFNVTGCSVKNLASGGTITDILSLNQAVSVGYRVTVAIVNNGHTVTQIYVTNIEAPGTWS